MRPGQGKERNEAPIFLSPWLGQAAEALGLESRRTVLLMRGRDAEDILSLHHSWGVGGGRLGIGVGTFSYPHT